MRSGRRLTMLILWTLVAASAGSNLLTAPGSPG